MIVFANWVFQQKPGLIYEDGHAYSDGLTPLPLPPLPVPPHTKDFKTISLSSPILRLLKTQHQQENLSTDTRETSLSATMSDPQFTESVLETYADISVM